MHNRCRRLEEHGRVWSTPRVEQMQFVTVVGILEYPILLVVLGHVVILDEVGDRFARVLDLLIPVAKGGECDGVDGCVDFVGAVVPVQQAGNALVPGGVALESITCQFIKPVSGKGDRDTGILWVIERGGLRCAEVRASCDGTTSCRPSAREKSGTCDNLGEGGRGEKEGKDEREAKHEESCLQQLG